MKKLLVLGRLLGGYLRAYGPAMALCLSPCALFPLLHFLGLGNLRETRYTALLWLVLLAAAFVVSFSRFAARQLALWEALRRLPPDPAALPEAKTSLEAAFREAAIAYGQEAQRQADASARAEASRADYYTLWVHQIKTPIAALNLIAQSDKPIDREQLRQEIFKIDQYVEAALTYERLTSIRSDLELEEIPLYPLCCKVVKKLRRLFAYRNIRLNLEPFEGSALSDGKWLGMALEQVLTNALKYTPEGGQITVALKEPQVLAVSDTGIGIRPEDAPRVFDRGFTGQAGRRGEKSTGIGLYLCRQACDLLGHRVSLTSRQGEGTCVVFDLRREGLEAFD